MTTNTQDPDLRDRAVTSLRKKREFLSHLVLYLIVNAFFVGIWTIEIRREMERLDDR